MAHIVNFMGSDTISGVLGARVYYGEQMGAFSIPAAEHSTITSWGRENEALAYKNMLDQFAKPGAIVAVVSDSYNILNACDIWGTTLKQQVIDSGALVVVRPDSGHPETVVLDVVRRLDSHYGSTVNAKGFKVLNNIRVIQGDGINEQSIRGILLNLKFAGYSADNVAFGMGGALLQIVNRDTQAFAMKCSSVEVRDQELGTTRWVDVYKDPIGDTSKKSKRGRVTLTFEGGEYKSGVEDWKEPVLKEVYRNGELLIDYTFAEVIANSTK
jgi:nicotinamide phosphoribosyltransferase